MIQGEGARFMEETKVDEHESLMNAVHFSNRVIIILKSKF